MLLKGVKDVTQGFAYQFVPPDVAQTIVNVISTAKTWLVYALGTFAVVFLGEFCPRANTNRARRTHCGAIGA